MSGLERRLVCVDEKGKWAARYEAVLYAREKRIGGEGVGGCELGYSGGSIG